MRILDLFAGTKGFSQAFEAAGDDVIALELSERFTVDAYVDCGDVPAVLGSIAQLRGPDWRPDVILASPPCNSFSTGSMGRMWEHGPRPRPKHPIAEDGMRLVLATVRIIAILQPRWYAIENPRGRLRSLDLLAGFTRHEVWQCRLGRRIAKPTDIWTNVPVDTSRLICHNGNGDHIAAPRGSRTGTQGGMSSTEAASLPFALSAMLRAAIIDPRTSYAEQLIFGLDAPRYPRLATSGAVSPLAQARK